MAILLGLKSEIDVHRLHQAGVIELSGGGSPDARRATDDDGSATCCGR